MKKFLPALLFAAAITASCSKETLTQPAATLTTPAQANMSKGSDDTAPDDRGGGVSSSGGGTRISAASVPAPVMNAYKSRFPNATRAEWKKLNNGNYKVEFFRSGVKWEAIFSAGGKLLKLERS
jgi:hypothetical protein